MWNYIIVAAITPFLISKCVLLYIKCLSKNKNTLYLPVIPRLLLLSPANIYKMIFHLRSQMSANRKYKSLLGDSTTYNNIFKSKFKYTYEKYYQAMA